MDIKQFFDWFWIPVKDHYVDFEGRATRQQFWMFVLVSFLIQFVLGAIRLEMVANLVGLAVMLPSIAIATRRLHDINKSGWWQLIILVPVVGLFVMIYFLVQKSDAGSNQYGVPVAVPNMKQDQNVRDAEVVTEENKEGMM